MQTTKFSREEYQHAIVVVGQFNPAIVQPAWLISKGWIGETEGNNARNLIVHSEIARMDFDSFGVEVTQERFLLKATQEPFFPLLRDLAVNIFERLKETPIKAVGINSVMHYKFENQANRDEFAWFVHPRTTWQKVLNDPRIWKAEMVEKRMNGRTGHLRVGMEVSELLKDNGCKFTLNDHYEISQSTHDSTKELVLVLKEEWEKSIQRQKTLVTDLWNLFTSRNEVK
jgi:hypothetical protein